MMYKFAIFFFVSMFSFGQEIKTDSLKNHPLDNTTIIENKLSISEDSLKIDSNASDSLKTDLVLNNNLFKKNVLATYYAKKFNGRKTANGQIFSNNKLTAAHKKLPFGTKLLVTNEKNGKSVIVTVNDRGPFGKNKEIDLSHKAFLAICNHQKEGIIKVNLEILK